MNNIFKLGLWCLGCLLIMSSCKYQKGDMYVSKSGSDSLLYVIAGKGSGDRLSEKAGILKIQHESKGNSCTVKYLTDSVRFDDLDGVILFNSRLPEIEDDMLSKGYFGTFTSKQTVSLILVSFEDLEKEYIKTKRKKPASEF